jgi:hypothetical protein
MRGSWLLRWSEAESWTSEFFWMDVDIPTNSVCTGQIKFCAGFWKFLPFGVVCHFLMATCGGNLVSPGDHLFEGGLKDGTWNELNNIFSQISPVEMKLWGCILIQTDDLSYDHKLSIWFFDLWVDRDLAIPKQIPKAIKTSNIRFNIRLPNVLDFN